MDDFHHFICPYCSQENSAFIDFSEGEEQDWVTDCEVCCRPIAVHVQLDGERIKHFSARMENE